MPDTRTERLWTLSWAIGQGLALLLLHEWTKALDRPDRLFWLIWPLYALAIGLPISLQLLAEHRRKPMLWRILGGFAAALVVMAVHDGWNVLLPDMTNQAYWMGSAFVLGLTMVVVWFVLLPFAQYRLREGHWGSDYPFLFSASWRNALRLASAAGFTGVFWMLLGLWAALFGLLGIHFFSDVFTNHAFVFPVTASAFGLGLALHQVREAMILGVYRAILNVFAWLLPLVAVLAAGFLAALPFTGLEPLWKTGHATALMLGLQAFVLFLFNAAWQDGAGESLPPSWLRRPLSSVLVLLPVYALLCAYSLSLRVTQYGWSGERVWAALLIFVVGFYSLGYARAALRRSDPWMAGVGKVNVAAALTLTALLFATATPLLDPERIGVASQVSRLLAGQVSATEFDYRYLRFDTGRLGTAALQRLAELGGHPQAGEIRREALAAQDQSSRHRGQIQVRTDWRAQDIAARLRVYPAGARVEHSFPQWLATRLNHAAYSHTCLKPNEPSRCTLLVLDLNGDEETEHVLFYSPYEAEVFQRKGENWLRVASLHPMDSGRPTTQEFVRDLDAGKLHVVEPEWQDMEIGGRRYQIMR